MRTFIWAKSSGRWGGSRMRSAPGGRHRRSRRTTSFCCCRWPNRCSRSEMRPRRATSPRARSRLLRITRTPSRSMRSPGSRSARARTAIGRCRRSRARSSANRGCCRCRRVAGPLALALDATPAPPDREALITQLARLPAMLGDAPALLLALAARACGDGTLPTTPRRFAARCSRWRSSAGTRPTSTTRCAASRSSPRRCAPMSRRTCARTMRRLCAYACAGPFPLAWPRRCAGDRLRVVAIVGPLVDDVVADAIAALAAAADRCLRRHAGVVRRRGERAAAAFRTRARSLRAMVVPRIAGRRGGQADRGAGRRYPRRPRRRRRGDRDRCLRRVRRASIVTVAALAAPNARAAGRSRPAAGHRSRDVPAHVARASSLRRRVRVSTRRRWGEAWERAVRAHQQGDHASARDGLWARAGTAAGLCAGALSARRARPRGGRRRCRARRVRGRVGHRAGVCRCACRGGEARARRGRQPMPPSRCARDGARAQPAAAGSHPHARPGATGAARRRRRGRSLRQRARHRADRQRHALQPRRRAADEAAIPRRPPAPTSARSRSSRT